jgi:hypothetical protein
MFRRIDRPSLNEQQSSCCDGGSDLEGKGGVSQVSSNLSDVGVGEREKVTHDRSIDRSINQ